MNFSEIRESQSDFEYYTQLISTMCPLGSFVGAFTAGVIAKHGRWNCLVLTNVVLLVGCSFTLLNSIKAICIGRLVLGWAAGSFSVFVPKYISETAPTHLKGPLGTLTQFYVTFGIMIAFLFGLAVPDIHKDRVVGNADP